MNPLQSIIVPHEIVNDECVTIIKCHFKNGDKVKEGDPLITIETSKMVEDFYAALDGYVTYLCQEGDEMRIGAVIIEIYEKPVFERRALAKEIMEKREASLHEGEAIFSQAALALMEELKINKEVFKGRDFVGTEDVKSLQRQPNPVPENADVAFQKITPFKKREIEYLSDVQSSNLSNVVSILIDITPSLAAVRQASKFFKYSLFPIIASKLPALLKEYPEFNAFYKEGTVGFYKNTILGFAINLGEGLRVLRLPDTQEKSIAEIEMMILELIKQYVAKKLTIKDMAGVTFTITDLSNDGIHFFVPLIPKGQSAILGVCAIDEKLGRVILSLSFDHRITDGKKASEFLRKLKTRIEA